MNFYRELYLLPKQKTFSILEFKNHQVPTVQN